LTQLHFAPTPASRDNLLKEGVSADAIFVTGNTVVDALFIAIEKVNANPPAIPGLPNENLSVFGSDPVVLITGHRRENFGGGFENICRAIATLSGKFPNVHFVYPVHLNPNVREPVSRILGAGSKNLHLIEPLSYLPFVSLLNRSAIVLTDSGGIQEEAPSLGKPVLVMRETTERPEAVAAGTVQLVGTDYEKIVQACSKLLTDHAAREALSRAHNPYGDGRSTPRILAACETFLASLKP
jgi:UDP-N-acetylglucosamine 2-epimerase (non-hydrolysing)